MDFVVFSDAASDFNVTSALTIPVGTAITPYQISINKEAINCHHGVIGDMSPYPTVVIVTIAQYTLFGILVNPLLAHSIRYIIDQAMIAMSVTVIKKTKIFCQDERIACTKTFPSEI